MIDFIFHMFQDSFYGLAVIKAKIARIALRFCNTEHPSFSHPERYENLDPIPTAGSHCNRATVQVYLQQDSLTLLSLALTRSFWNDDISEHPTNTFPKMQGWCSSPHDRPFAARPSLGKSFGVLGLDVCKCANA